MAHPNSWRIGYLRRRFPFKPYVKPYGKPYDKPPSLWHSQRSQKKPPDKFFGDRNHRKEWTRSPSIRYGHHFGTKARLPDSSQTTDRADSALAAQQLTLHASTVSPSYELVNAAAKVGRVEICLDYTFRNKMICIQALNATSSVLPLRFQGMIHREPKNNRMALLGDRVLRLALCDLWYDTGNSPGDYQRMHVDIETRAALCIKARSLGLHKEILIVQSHPPTADQIAEAFEAILGAVYLDSSHDIGAVKKVIKGINLDEHKFLMTPNESEEQYIKELFRVREEGRNLKAALINLKRVETELSRQIQNAGISTENGLRDKHIRGSQTRTDSKRKVGDDLQPVENLLPKERKYDGVPAIPTRQKGVSSSQTKKAGIGKGTQGPSDVATQLSSTKATNPVNVKTSNYDNPVAAVFRGEQSRLTARPTPVASKRARARWRRKERNIRAKTLIAAREKAAILEQQGLPTDTAVLFETMLQSELDNFLEEEREAEILRKGIAAELKAKSLEDSKVSYNDVSPEAETVTSRMAYAFARLRCVFFASNNTADVQGGSAEAHESQGENKLVWRRVKSTDPSSPGFRSPKKKERSGW